MLRISAERALKAVTGQSILAYAQHDTVSQASLISESVKDELALASKKDHAMTIGDLKNKLCEVGVLRTLKSNRCLILTLFR